MVRALWHGPDRDGKFEVEPLAGELPARYEFKLVEGEEKYTV